MKPSSKQKISTFSLSTLGLIETLGLFVITIATVAAGVQEVIKIIQAGQVTLGDLLLLFIYLEVLAMVAVYYESGSLPIRMPIYIAIVALARHMTLDMKEMSEISLIATAGAILVLTLAVLTLKFGKKAFPDKNTSRPLNSMGLTKDDELD